MHTNIITGFIEFFTYDSGALRLDRQCTLVLLVLTTRTIETGTEGDLTLNLVIVNGNGIEIEADAGTVEKGIVTVTGEMIKRKLNALV